MKLFFSKILAGFVIGAGAIIPGLSGGILAVSMGIYQSTIEAITGFFKAPKKNFRFLLPLGIGGVIGLVIFMFLIDSLFANYQTEVVCLFMGLVIGSIPSFINEANDGESFRKSNWIYIATGFAFAFTLVLLGFFTGNSQVGASRELTPLLSALCGGIVMLGIVMPGVSTSFILINMNVYKSFMEVFTNFFSDPGKNIVLALFALLGILFVSIPMLMLVRKVLQKFHRQSFYVLFGILLATLAGCVLQEGAANASGVSFLEFVIFIVLFACGIAASYFMDKAMKNLELKEQDGSEPAVS
ncbi:MAG: DUF368 domain-containing protein [Christensenellaceae bacterium]|nr:DUF368 domain-containing protein [Christensenellaceae bacterium]